MESVKPQRESDAGPAEPPRKHPVPHHIARAILRPLFRAYFGMRAEGLEHLPRSAPCIKRRVPRPGGVTVIVGQPLPPSPRGDRAMQSRLAEALMQRVADLLDGKPCESAPW